MGFFRTSKRHVDPQGREVIYPPGTTAPAPLEASDPNAYAQFVASNPALGGPAVPTPPNASREGLAAAIAAKAKALKTRRKAKAGTTPPAGAPSAAPILNPAHLSAPAPRRPRGAY